MQKQFRILSYAALVLALSLLALPYAQAQILGGVEADITHPFIIANTTLPAGHYVFRMLQGTELTAMTATDEKTDAKIEFLVNEARVDHTPPHSELIFDRYDNQEFLKKVFEGGSKVGVAVAEPSRIEKRMQQQGKHPVEHKEEQAK
jgi:hypothetical protein